MHVVITGATGNVGTSVLSALASEAQVESILGLARRTPDKGFAKARFAAVDVSRDPLSPHFAGADAVVHLAWQLRPSHDFEQLARTNIDGSRRVFQAAADSGVRSIVYASSVGTYAEADKLELHGEHWPASGIVTSTYSRHKAEVERMLDEFETKYPALRVVRLRPALIFKRAAASRIRELFFGRLLPRQLFNPQYLRWMLDHPCFRFQAVHGDDVGEAFRLALITDVRGPFNLAADPILDSEVLARTFGAKKVPVNPESLRRLVHLAYVFRLQPAEAGWIDLCFLSPLLDCSRAREQLGWQPRRTSIDALLELLTGLREGAEFDTPPLHGRDYPLPEKAISAR